MVQCVHCNKFGHSVAECWHLKRWKKHLERVQSGKVAEGIPFCTHCQRYGHFLSDCSSNKKESERKRGKLSSRRSTADVKCRIVDEKRMRSQAAEEFHCNEAGVHRKKSENLRLFERRSPPGERNHQRWHYGRTRDDGRTDYSPDYRLGTPTESRRHSLSSISPSYDTHHRRHAAVEEPRRNSARPHKRNATDLENRSRHPVDFERRGKTQMCRYYTARRRCPWADRCYFAHGKHELVEPQRTAPTPEKGNRSAFVGKKSQQNQQYPDKRPTEAKRKRQKIQGSGSGGQASNQSATSENASVNTSERKRLFCLVCNKSGHSTESCREAASFADDTWLTHTKKESRYCLICNTAGHSTDNCPGAASVTEIPAESSSSEAGGNVNIVRNNVEERHTSSGNGLPSAAGGRNTTVTATDVSVESEIVAPEITATAPSPPHVPSFLNSSSPFSPTSIVEHQSVHVKKSGFTAGDDLGSKPGVTEVEPTSIPVIPGKDCRSAAVVSKQIAVDLMASYDCDSESDEELTIMI